MRHRSIILMSILLFLMTGLYGYSLIFEEPLLVGSPLQAVLTPDAGDGPLLAARFYLPDEAQQELNYIEFEEKEGSYVLSVGGDLLPDEQIAYFIELQREDSSIERIPSEGVATVTLGPDTEPPQLSLTYPESGSLVAGMSSVVVFTSENEQSLKLSSLKIDGRQAEDFFVYGPIIQGFYTPRSTKDLSVTIDVEDAYGNRSELSMRIPVTGQMPKRFFTFDTSWSLDGRISYQLESEQEGLEVPGTLLDEGSLISEVDLEGGASLWAEATAGPLAIAVSLDLGDSRPLSDYLNATGGVTDLPYLSASISDFYDILRLYDPYSFIYSDPFLQYQSVREYEAENYLLLEASLFGDLLRYRFGDQQADFQSQTVSNLSFRGSSVLLDLPLLSIQAASGFVDPGLLGVSWPRVFAGVQAGIDLFDLWYLQTNVSLVSDYQGTYESTSAGERPVGELFELTDGPDYLIDPQENLVIGLGTGIETALFSLRAEGGMTICVDDAGSVADISGLATAFGADPATLEPIEGYIDLIDSYFPLFDYFPLSLGIAYDALDLDLWGFTYGADLEIPAIGLSAWFRKTDGSYSSLASSLTTGMLETGGLFEFPLGSWQLLTGYSYEKNNIPDILLTDILPLVSTFVTLPAIVTDITDSLDPTTDMATITHEGTLTIKSPNLGLFGRLTLGGGLQYQKSDALVSDPEYDQGLSILAEGSWRSATWDLGPLSINLKADSEDSYVIPGYIDGVQQTGGNHFILNAGGELSLSLAGQTLAGGYERDWSTETGSDTVHTIRASLSLKEILIDRIVCKGSWEQTFESSGAFTERTIDAELSLKKSFGLISTGMDFSAGFTDSTDDADDQSEFSAKVYGQIEL